MINIYISVPQQPKKGAQTLRQKNRRKKEIKNWISRIHTNDDF